jgi:hypothetical protein
METPIESPRHQALQIVRCRHERGVWAAKAQRHAETLAVADGDVRAEFAPAV